MYSITQDKLVVKHSCKIPVCKCKRQWPNGWVTIHCPGCGRTECGVSPNGVIHCFRKVKCGFKAGLQDKRSDWHVFADSLRQVAADMNKHQVLIHEELGSLLRNEWIASNGWHYTGDYGVDGILADTDLVQSRLPIHSAWGPRLQTARKLWHKPDRDGRVLDVDNAMWMLTKWIDAWGTASAYADPTRPTVITPPDDTTARPDVINLPLLFTGHKYDGAEYEIIIGV